MKINVVEGSYPALMDKITIPRSLSGQSSLCPFNTNITPSTRPFMTKVMENMVHMGIKLSKVFFVQSCKGVAPKILILFLLWRAF